MPARNSRNSRPLNPEELIGHRTKARSSLQSYKESAASAAANLAALCYGIALANRVYDAESIRQKHTIGKAAGAAIAAIDDVISSQSMTTLAKHQRTFSNLRHGVTPTADDEERAL